MAFSFLHISDIHFGDQTTDQEAAREEILNKIQIEQIKADCLIISGDLFNKGLLTSKNADKLIDFIKDLPGISHIYVVPGNHDLNRFACQEKDGYNEVLRRAELVNKYKKILEKEDKEFIVESEEKPVIYEGSFGEFRRFCTNIGAESFTSESTTEASSYEVEIVSQSKNGIKVRFVLLNTALISGQSVKGEEFRNRESTIEKDYNDAIQSQQPLLAAKKLLELEQLRDRFRRDGELIVDEEKRNPGTQSLSRDGNYILSHLKPGDEDLTIFVGHHGLEYIADKTRTALIKKAMKNSGRVIYLCGHAHQESAGNIQQYTEIPGLLVQSGVLFGMEDGYTQYGFNYGIISSDAVRIECNVKMWTLIRSPSGDTQWISYTVSRPWVKPIRTEDDKHERSSLELVEKEDNNKRNVVFEEGKGAKD